MERGKNRDPRRGRSGSRGGSRGAIRPRIQSQPQPYHPGPESSSQPPPYHPEMYPQSPQFFYSQQQPLPQIPTNFDPFESSYTQQSPPPNPNFNPYEPRYTQQKRRERVIEPLPIPFDTDEDEYFDNVDVVPETQPNAYVEEEEEVEEVEEVVVTKKKPKTWTPEEEEALAKAWIKISVDKDVGDRQPKLGFWKRILKHFRTLVPNTDRTHHQLTSKWRDIHPLIAAFNGYFTQANRLRDSGCGDVQVLERANRDFEKHYRKSFAHSKAWQIVKDQPKWQEQPMVTQTQESTGSSKKRKSSESSSAQTPVNVEDFECELPNLNENPTPSRPSKGKKKATSGDSSRSSLRDAFQSYTSEKKSLMQAQLEVQKKKDDEYLKFIQGEVYNRDMKFVSDPHDHITDPVFKEFVIKRKRELCAQYGWPCGL